jgi:hypothetical protein
MSQEKFVEGIRNQNEEQVQDSETGFIRILVTQN